MSTVIYNWLEKCIEVFTFSSDRIWDRSSALYIIRFEETAP